MSFSVLFAYINSFMYYALIVILYLNKNLDYPSQMVKPYLLLPLLDVLPPLIFSGGLFMYLYSFFYYANNLLCNMFGIIYPTLYSLDLVVKNQFGIQNHITLNRYWILFGMITLLDGFFGNIFSLVPGYYHHKILLTYFLVRNDFFLSNYLFDYIQSSFLFTEVPIEQETNLRTRTPLCQSVDTK